MKIRFLFPRLVGFGVVTPIAILATLTLSDGSVWAADQLHKDVSRWNGQLMDWEDNTRKRTHDSPFEVEPSMDGDIELYQKLRKRSMSAMAQRAKSWSQARRLEMASFSGRCVSVTDGDTLIVKRNGVPVVVDLKAIDAPETNQRFGIDAKAALSALALGYNLRVYPTGRDATGKIQAWVFQGKTELNRAQVVAGNAWWSQHQAPTETEIALLQRKARAARLGLWNKAAPISPWDWRKQQQKRL